MNIPNFDSQEVLPPFILDPSDPSKTSPYMATTSEFCQFFATSQARIRIIRGFLAFRATIGMLYNLLRVKNEREKL